MSFKPSLHWESARNQWCCVYLAWFCYGDTPAKAFAKAKRMIAK